MKIVDMKVGMQVVGKKTATIYTVIQIPNPTSSVALIEREDGKRQYVNTSYLLPLTQQHDTIIRQERKKWFKWLNHYAVGQPSESVSVVDNHVHWCQVFSIPLKDLKEAT